uniref:Uncharacterized protein n=1 Tax=Romanomermis culicivorax TaxID=13658 RepID=A0A915JZB9_ROMCU
MHDGDHDESCIENAAMIFGKPQAAKSSDSSRGYGNDDDDDSESSEEIEATMTTTKNVVPSSTIPRQDVVDNHRCLLQKDPNFMVISGAAGGTVSEQNNLCWNSITQNLSSMTGACSFARLFREEIIGVASPIEVERIASLSSDVVAPTNFRGKSDVLISGINFEQASICIQIFGEAGYLGYYGTALILIKIEDIEVYFRFQERHVNPVV